MFDNWKFLAIVSGYLRSSSFRCDCLEDMFDLGFERLDVEVLPFAFLLSLSDLSSVLEDKVMVVVPSSVVRVAMTSVSDESVSDECVRLFSEYRFVPGAIIKIGVFFSKAF